MQGVSLLSSSYQSGHLVWVSESWLFVMRGSSDDDDYTLPVIPVIPVPAVSSLKDSSLSLSRSRSQTQRSFSVRWPQSRTQWDPASATLHMVKVWSEGSELARAGQIVVLKLCFLLLSALINSLYTFEFRHTQTEPPLHTHIQPCLILLQACRQCELVINSF